MSFKPLFSMLFCVKDNVESYSYVKLIITTYLQPRAQMVYV